MMDPKELKVLLIDDEVQIRRLLRVFLERNGWRVLEAVSGEEGIGETARCSPDAILLDLGLPDLDGLEVLKRLREWTEVPILVVSVRGNEDDKITALNGGADDYITKPFSTGELLARLRVAQRHAQHSTPAATTFSSGPLHVDLATRTVKLRGKRIKLTVTEYSLLQLFVKHAGKVLTHNHLLKEIWGEDSSNIGYLRVYMAYLREKLEDNPAEPELFITEPGVGYRMVLQP